MGITEIKEWYMWFKNGTSKLEPCQVNADYTYIHSSLRLLDFPKIENGDQRKAVRRLRDDSE